MRLIDFEVIFISITIDINHIFASFINRQTAVGVIIFPTAIISFAVDPKAVITGTGNIQDLTAGKGEFVIGERCIIKFNGFTQIFQIKRSIDLEIKRFTVTIDTDHIFSCLKRRQTAVIIILFPAVSAVTVKRVIAGFAGADSKNAVLLNRKFIKTAGLIFQCDTFIQRAEIVRFIDIEVKFISTTAGINDILTSSTNRQTVICAIIFPKAIICFAVKRIIAIIVRIDINVKQFLPGQGEAVITVDIVIQCNSSAQIDLFSGNDTEILSASALPFLKRQKVGSGFKERY